jgi:hypothetical protein
VTSVSGQACDQVQSPDPVTGGLVSGSWQYRTQDHEPERQLEVTKTRNKKSKKPGQVRAGGGLLRRAGQKQWEVGSAWAMGVSAAACAVETENRGPDLHRSRLRSRLRSRARPRPRADRRLPPNGRTYSSATCAVLQPPSTRCPVQIHWQCANRFVSFSAAQL